MQVELTARCKGVTESEGRSVLESLIHTPGCFQVHHLVCNLMSSLERNEENTLPQNSKAFLFELCSTTVAFDIQS